MNDAEYELQQYMDTIPQPKTYAQLREEMKAEQAGMTKEQVTQKMQTESEYAFDPETAVPQEHNWVDRGEIMSCEGARHPNHRHFKVKRR